MRVSRNLLLLLMVLPLLPIVIITAQDDTCPADFESWLAVGVLARVTPGDPNTVREGPTTAAARLGSIPGEGVFTVLDGPACADGFVWWQVDHDGLVGWTVEGTPSEYWIVHYRTELSRGGGGTEKATSIESPCV
ncbi:MAG: SH3 domain-containing protein, partial [Chloroflexota bacterium]